MRRLITALLLTTTSAVSGAQAPGKPHHTISTEHFQVHFTPALEPVARRAAASAERAYARLANELVAPRAPIDILVADNVDYANGYATVFPTNRIVIYAHPPIESPSLRYNDDWIDLVVTHELVHVFHLDRARGMWRLLQGVFGRAPFLFPNGYSPRWVTEGVATWYESRLTGAGRVFGTNHASHLRAAAVEGQLPRLDQLSVATPVFPGGQGVYIYGSLFIDYLARTRGAGTVRALIERQAVHPLPFMLNRVSKSAFGVSYASAWDEFTDSIARAAGDDRPPLPGWRDLTPASFAADFVRWTDATSLVYTGSAPRELFGAWGVTLGTESGRSGDGVGTESGRSRDGVGTESGRSRDGVEPHPARHFLGRRNGVTPHSRTADGSLVYAQPDYVSPYEYRGDLYVERDGDVERLTRGARLSAPDARADGQVVAVQAVAGGTRLVLFDLATRRTRAITGGGLDEWWAEPVWSPDGASIAAVRWQRGGASAIIVLDSLGEVREELAIARAVQSGPSWSPSGRSILFASDVGGQSDVYVVDVGRGAPPRRVSRSATALYEPRLSPDGTHIAAVRLGADGFHVGIAPANDLQPEAAAGAWPAVRAYSDTVIPTAGDARRYSAFRQLLPRYWIPVVEGENGIDTRIGAYTTGEDILGRHSYYAQAAFPVEGRGITGGIAYQFAGFAQPLLSASAWQDWAYRGFVRGATPADTAALVHRLERDVALSATFRRPRVRSNFAFTLGAGAEWRQTSLDRDVDINRPPEFFADSLLPRVTASIGYARTVAAPYAISPEDGFTASLGAINYWVAGTGAPSSRTITGTVNGYKSFDLGGYARHVAALRIAGGVTDTRTVNELEVGGVSGNPIPLAFGFAEIGEGRRTFFVRGFDARTLWGTRAWAASAEYRAPLSMLARGAGLLPLFLDRTSATLFADAGSAWCTTFVAGLCQEGNPKTTLASVGAEARLTAAIASWDTPFLFRLGVAVPVVERDRARNPATVYFTSGLSF